VRNGKRPLGLVYELSVASGDPSARLLSLACARGRARSSRVLVRQGQDPTAALPQRPDIRQRLGIVPSLSFLLSSTSIAYGCPSRMRGRTTSTPYYAIRKLIVRKETGKRTPWTHLLI
jgi:hypothetical protein